MEYLTSRDKYELHQQRSKSLPTHTSCNSLMAFAASTLQPLSCWKTFLRKQRRPYRLLSTTSISPRIFQPPLYRLPNKEPLSSITKGVLLFLLPVLLIKQLSSPQTGHKNIPSTTFRSPPFSKSPRSRH